MSREEALKRWPDDDDMVEPVIGEGRWATVSWCGLLTVHLHDDQSVASASLRMMDEWACGHSCCRDHELVDLLETQRVDADQEKQRADTRRAHIESCDTCRTYSPKPVRQAVIRHYNRLFGELDRIKDLHDMAHSDQTLAFLRGDGNYSDRVS